MAINTFKTRDIRPTALEKDNSNTTQHSTAKYSSSIVYANSSAITGLENSKIEFQEQVTNAQKANQENMEMLLRERAALRMPVKYQEYDLQ